MINKILRIDFSNPNKLVAGYEIVEDEDPEIENIEDDEEYEAAADAFDELLDEQEFDDEEEEEE